MTIVPDRETPPRMTSYVEEAANFKIDVPERFNAVVGIVEEWAQESPRDLAVLSINGAGGVAAAQTAGDLAAAASRTARALLRLGVRKGDRIFVMLPRIPEWYDVILGAMRIGAVVVPGPNQLTARDIAYRVRSAGVSVAITNASGAARVDQIGDDLELLAHKITCGEGSESGNGWLALADILDESDEVPLPEDPTSREDPLLLFFTSGTTSHAKMVVHDHSYALASVRTARFWHDLRPGDIHWTVSDTGWAKAAWGGLFGQWHERSAVLQAALATPDADSVLRVIADHGVTSFCAPPTLYRSLVQANLSSYDLSSLRHCTSAGEPLNPEVIRGWSAGTDGLTIYDGYGQTESTLLVANFRAVPVRPGSMGRPTPGYDIAVVDEDGERVLSGEVGNIAVNTSPHPVGLFHGYEAAPDATKAAFRNGWYYTGDRATLDDDGYLWFVGRSDDVITSSAYRIGPFEVESALVEHPSIVEAAVVGRDDPQRTQIVCAFVILASGVEPSDELTKELQDHVKRVTAPYKYPREIHYVTSLPKTISGKIRRNDLRDQLRGSESETTAPSSGR